MGTFISANLYEDYLGESMLMEWTHLFLKIWIFLQLSFLFFKKQTKNKQLEKKSLKKLNDDLKWLLSLSSHSCQEKKFKHPKTRGPNSCVSCS